MSEFGVFPHSVVLVNLQSIIIFLLLGLQTLFLEPFVPLTEEEEAEVVCAFSNSNRYGCMVF